MPVRKRQKRRTAPLPLDHQQEGDAELNQLRVTKVLFQLTEFLRTPSTPSHASAGRDNLSMQEKVVTDVEETRDAVVPRDDLPSSTSGGNNNMALMSLMVTMQQQILLLQQNVTKIQSGRQDSGTHVGENHATLHTAYNSMFTMRSNAAAGSEAQLTSSTQHMYGPNGIHPDMLPHMDVVSASLREAIAEGKDVNLSALLIPGYELSTNNAHCPHAQVRTDKRLTENLSISEFIVAFNKYRRIMCDAYPQRQKELDLYENLLIRIHGLYGGQALNDYHKLFSAKSAEALRVSSTKVDWSFTDQAIYSMVTAGRRANACNTCDSITHATPQCPMSNQSGPSTQHNRGKQKGDTSTFRKQDQQGRICLYHNGKEVCNNLNEEKGCAWVPCRFAYVCAQCKASTHGQHVCPKLKRAPKNKS